MALPVSASRPVTQSDVIKHETDPLTGRALGKVLAGAGAARTILIGTVVAKVTATGQIVALNPAGADGSEDAIGIAITEVTAPDGADSSDDLLYVNRNALASAEGLVWPAGITAPQKVAALVQLGDLGITVRPTY